MKASIVATIVGAIFLTLLSPPANALATRTWVSGVGSDSNPCSRTQPCLTFGAALSQTSAGGEIDCLDSGGFGIVTINQAVTIKCDQALGGVTASGTNGIDIAAGPNDVVSLEGLDINGIGSGLAGISFTSGKALHVSNCVIRSFTAEGINFAPGNPATLVVQDSKVVDNTTGGILVAPTLSVVVHATITNTHMDRNQFGLKAKDYGFASVFNSTAANNTNNGIIAASTLGAGAIISVSHSLVTDNAVYGITASGSLAEVSIFEVSIFQNVTAGIFTTGGGTVATWTPATNANSGGGAPNGFLTLQ